MIRIIFLLTLLLTNIAFSDDRDLNIQDTLKQEYGSCYIKFQQNIEFCTPFSCNYPDYTDVKVWKAQTINGFKNGFCYVVYYSYIGSDIIDSPDHCFYSSDDLKNLNALYQGLFKEGSVIAVAELKAKIIALNKSICKKMKT